MYSSWHLEIAKKYNVPLMITSDVGRFMRLGNDIYNLSYCFNKVHEYLLMLEEMNEKGEVSDDEVLKELDDILNNRNKDFPVEKTISLDEFEEKIKKIAKK